MKEQRSIAEIFRACNISIVNKVIGIVGLPHQPLVLQAVATSVPQVHLSSDTDLQEASTCKKNITKPRLSVDDAESITYAGTIPISDGKQDRRMSCRLAFFGFTAKNATAWRDVRKGAHCKIPFGFLIGDGCAICDIITPGNVGPLYRDVLPGAADAFPGVT